MTDTRTPALSLALVAETLAEQATAVYRQARRAVREALGDESLSAAGHGGLLDREEHAYQLHLHAEAAAREAAALEAAQGLAAVLAPS